MTERTQAPARLPWRTRIGVAVGNAARAASRALGRGSGGMIGGEIAQRLAPAVLADLSRPVRSVIVSGTNGKSTTTRMTRAALSSLGPVASNTNGDNMASGVVTALMDSPGARLGALEVDEMHVPLVAHDVNPAVLVLLNLSRDQLDRVGEIGSVELRLRRAVEEHPGAVVVANCDDPLIVSAACRAPRVVWVAAGAGWGADATAYPRGGRVVRDADGWHVVASREGEPLPEPSSRPDPHWWLSDVVLAPSGAAGPTAVLHGPDGVVVPLALSLPGRANLGNAAQAVAAAVALGADPAEAARRAGAVREVAGRYATHDVEGRTIRMMLAKNPAGWQEAMTMIDPGVDQVVIGVNGQVPDGQDLSWLWDVDFSALGDRRRVVACGERGADLAVRLEYAGVPCSLAATPMDALRRCEPGGVEMLLNYTALRDFKALLDARPTKAGR
ncbi:MurT ligase domain-containing protein [Actinomyces sp. B33]|uniref:MurT ligase domain-containing protein n=1 Tax=Actinomyces sp. B33 TaxID=2942131 RepID=UPI0023409A81|nr:MurT ligase domain-containing protein [Actinomyces sp. B33]MDC4232262.1 MurT ligase domain-containing protein [Actinomyces sp. B33]